MVYQTGDQTSIKTVENRIKQPLANQVKSEERIAIETTKVEAQSYYYSGDQIINNAIIEALYDICFEYFLQNDSFSKNMLSVKQIDQLNKFFQHCKEINSTYPEFNLDNREAFYQNKINKTPNELLNLLVRNGSKFSKDFNLGINVIKQIRNENPNIMLIRNVKYEFLDFYVAFYLADIYELLQTQHEYYVWSIMQYAQTLFACNRGAECGENSMELLLQCYHNEMFCGVKSYQEFINTKLTKSQQHDIYLTVEFIENIFDNDN